MANEQRSVNDMADEIKAYMDSELTSKDLLNDTVGWTGKNVMPNNAPDSYSQGGITFTKYSDGKYSSSAGTTTKNVNGYYLLEGFVLPAGTYIYSGFPDGTNTNPEKIFMDIKSSWATSEQIARLDADHLEAEFTLSQATALYARPYFISGETIPAMTFSPMIRKKGEPAGYEPYHESVKETLRDAEVIDGANLLPFHTQFKTFQFFADENGYVSCSTGSDTRGWNYESSNEYITLPAGTYKYKAFQKTGSTSGYTGFKIHKSNGTRVLDGTIDGALAGGTFTLSEASDLGVVYKLGNGSYAFQIINENEDNNVYHIWHEPLKDRKLDIVDQQTLGAWNLLQNQATSQSKDNITYTVNSDGSISTSNTSATAKTYLTVFESSDKFKADTYYLSGCPVGGGWSGYQMLLRTSTDKSTWTLAAGDIGSGGTLELATDSYIKVEICIHSGQSTGGKTFYPMIALKPNMPYVPYAMTNKELTDANSINTESISDLTYRTNFAGAGGNITSAAILASYMKQGLGHLRFVDGGNLFGFGTTAWVKVLYMAQNAYGSAYDMAALLIVSPLSGSYIKFYTLNGTSGTSFTLTKISSIS